MAGLNQTLKAKAKGGTVLHGLSEWREKQSNIVDFQRIPTGIFPFDYAVGGGIPCNVITQFYGPEQSGKSTLSYIAARGLSRFCMRCMQPIALCQCEKDAFGLYCPTCGKPAGECKHASLPIELCNKCGKSRIDCTCGTQLIQKTFLCHFEGMPPDDLYFRTLQYDADQHLVVGLPEVGEEGCEMIEAAAKSDDCGLIIVDSLAGIVPRAELDAAYDDALVANQARLIARLFRRLSVILVNEYRRGHRVGVIFINQLRAKIGAGKWESNETTPGGWASRHGYRLSVRVSQLSSEDKDTTNQLKNASRFSASLLGPSSKQQMLILAGKAEYKIVMQDFDGYQAGAIMDANAITNFGKKTGLLDKGSKYYELKTTDMQFRVLSDLENMLKAGEYADPETGEVSAMPFPDDVARFIIMKRAKEQATRALLTSRAAKLSSM